MGVFCIGVTVWICGCMDVLVNGYMNVWVYGCMGKGCMGVFCIGVTVWMCGCKCMDVLVNGYMCGCMAVWMCR